ncbi:methyltransferase FkbM domain protein [SAR86 cluster bacterium SAR86E]|jgi:FkbM family methyltransferase|uniref:Methyltransferase FkbM domain protein n=1 Tax=SAR86 cluster bacterium SAR86E TaxID=1208365 RepID=K6GG92_9GAMM|nr:methyltransferase FkbM domain protein [SAR86 cluster bacterium SAR86E]
MKQNLANIKLLRKIVFPILRGLNFEYGWKHDVTLRKLHLLTWLHKGYWFYGSQRESSELKLFSKLINKGDCVLEIGGHIGYLTQIFEDLVGAEGKVLVAEPTIESRYLLEKNVRDSTKVLPFAMADEDGEMDFYTEKFGGFTNSLVSEFVDASNESLSESQQNSKNLITRVSVKVKTVDSICEQHSVNPSFLKIDVEGAELSVLKGAKQVLRNTKALMVEVSRNHKEVFNLLKAYNFIAIDAEGISMEEEITDGTKNIFFVK